MGYAFDRFLVYGTGGAAFGNIQASFSNDPVSSATETGWTVGAGVEVAFAPNWTAKAEYLFVDLSRWVVHDRLRNRRSKWSALIPNIAIKYNESLLRGGVNYRFNL